MLEARHLHKHFGGVMAVRDVSFTVGAGEVVGDDVQGPGLHQ